MTLKGLNFIAQKLFSVDIPYCFEVWEKDITYPYFVGEYIGNSSINETGECEETFLLTGTTIENWLSLERCKDIIRTIFPDYGITNIFSDGSAIAVMYDGSRIIPTGSDILKRIQINLKIKEWRVI